MTFLSLGFGILEVAMKEKEGLKEIPSFRQFMEQCVRPSEM